MSIHPLPIKQLVEARCRELRLSRSELARLCGYRNVVKGIRRIDEVLEGDFHLSSSKMIVAALPGALKLEKEIVDSALRESA